MILVYTDLECPREIDGYTDDGDYYTDLCEWSGEAAEAARTEVYADTIVWECPSCGFENETYVRGDDQ